MNDEIKRLRRIIVLSWTALLVLIIIFAGWVSVQVRHTKFIAQETSNTLLKELEGVKAQAVQPAEVVQGKDGRDGRDGKDGVNAETVHIHETSIQNIPVPGPQGSKGDQGEPGKSGREIEIATDALTGTHLFRYVGDEEWQVVPKINLGVLDVE